jgi:hypothetical protein
MSDVEAERSTGHLVLEGRCPECGGPYQAELWDHTHRCEFCSSLLIFAREAGSEVWIVSDSRRETAGLTELYIDLEALAYEGHLRAMMNSQTEGVTFEIPAVVELKTAAFRAKLRDELRLVARVDFYAPYEMRELTVFQGILGRRVNGPKESYIQSFQVEEIDRLYDTAAWSLRDRGLKIGGFRLRPVEPADLERCGGRFLPAQDGPSARSGPAIDRSLVEAQPDCQIINRVNGVWKERRLRAWKPFTYAAFERAGRPEHVLFDQQFGQIAARLEPQEAPRFAGIAARPASELVDRPGTLAIAAECPNCGWVLELPPQERIVFCATCLRAVRVSTKGLELSAYRVAPRLAGVEADHWLWFPFWSFDFQLRAGGAEYRRIWSWLEAVSPQPDALRHRETDPAESRLYIPARNLHGTPELDRAWESLTGWMNWRQPELSADRPPPDPTLRFLGAELEAAVAARLARYALLALHDVPSTRRLNGMNFRAMIAEAEIEVVSGELVAVPLPISGERFAPANLRPTALAVLRADGSTPRSIKSYGLL